MTEPQNESEEVDKLVDELFKKIEGSQGHFHWSDGENHRTKDALFGVIRWRLKHGEKAVHIMRAFLRKYNQY